MPDLTIFHDAFFNHIQPKIRERRYPNITIHCSTKDKFFDSFKRMDLATEVCIHPLIHNPI